MDQAKFADVVLASNLDSMGAISHTMQKSFDLLFLTLKHIGINQSLRLIKVTVFLGTLLCTFAHGKESFTLALAESSVRSRFSLLTTFFES